MSDPEQFDWGTYLADSRQRLEALEVHRASCDAVPCTRCDRGRCRCGGAYDMSSEHERCERCRAEEQAVRALGRVVATIPPRFRWAASGDLGVLAERVRLEPDRIAKAVASPPAGSMMLVGDTGTGKTSLAVAMLVAAVRSSPHLRDRDMFASSFVLAGARGRHPLGKGEAPEVEAAMSAPLLLLDDLGSEGEGRQNVLSEVIFARHEADLPTWVTTGFPAELLMARYGSAIIRRVLETGKPIRLGAR
jgi:DNA replication protein DnaC